ncbi:MAG: glycosyltransferase family 4 protein [Ardenticatenaceae bacterium]
MNIILDGVIFEQQARGGIPRIYQEILPRLCFLDPTIQFLLLTYGPIRSKWPDHAQIIHRRLWPLNRYIQPGASLWSFKKRVRSWIAGVSLSSHAHEIWHSTHYTLPHKWKGPILISAYDLLIERFAPVFDEPLYHQIRAEMRRCIAAADGVICISETTKKEMADFYQTDSSKLYVVPLAHSEVFQPLALSDLKDELAGQKPFFLYVGGRGRYKNFKIILEAFEIWPQKADVDLVVVGAEWTAAEKEALTEKNLHPHVRLVGHLDDQRLCVLYNRAQALIYPSLYEGFGLPPLEAMACGCLVIASHIPSTLEVAGEVPIYFEPTEPESLRDAFDITVNETQNKDRVCAGFAHLNNYSWDKTAKQTLNLYQLFSP